MKQNFANHGKTCRQSKDIIYIKKVFFSKRRCEHSVYKYLIPKYCKPSLVNVKCWVRIVVKI